MTQYNSKQKQKGFTLIELVVVIAILAILAAFAVCAAFGAGAPVEYQGYRWGVECGGCTCKGSVGDEWFHYRCGCYRGLWQ